MESVQRIVLTAVWPESVGEPEEILLVDGFENRRDRLLDDFECSAAVSSRRPSECRFVWPDAPGNCPGAPCRAVPSAMPGAESVSSER